MADKRGAWGKPPGGGSGNGGGNSSWGKPSSAASTGATAKPAGKTVAAAAADGGGGGNQHLTFVLTNMVGLKVQVQVASGKVYQGIYHGSSTVGADGGNGGGERGVALHMAYLKADAKGSSAWVVGCVVCARWGGWWLRRRCLFAGVPPYSRRMCYAVASGCGCVYV